MSSGLTGIACTDEQWHWNAGTQRNLAPKRLRDINFEHHKAAHVYQPSKVTTDVSHLPPTPKYDSQAKLKESLPVGSLLYKCAEQHR